MSIFTGLIDKTNEIVGVAGQINWVGYNRRTRSHLSTVWKQSSSCGSFSKEVLQGAEYPSKISKNLIDRKTFTYSLYVYDGKTNAIISPTNLNYEILYVNIKNAYTSRKVGNVFEMTFDNLPSKIGINMTIRVTGENYLNAYVQMNCEEVTDEYSQSVGIVNINNVPDGVFVVTETLEQDANGTIQEYVLNFPSTPTKTESATITIPQGTKFYDKNNVLLTGDLNFKAGHFSADNPVSYSLFSPGWNVSNIMVDGQLQSGVNFITGGFYAIEIIDSAGKRAKNINI